MMSYDMKDIDKKLDKVVVTTNKAVNKAIKRIAEKQQGSFASFDEIESMSIPSSTSFQTIISGPNLEDYVVSKAVDDELNRRIRESTKDIMQSVSHDLKGVLK